ncbi:MAG: M56 family metallopeptidase [Deltaproteobacteria bacterium]|nr:M56 family metallopeptidase [Deltaproteobacteria bacterium]
MSALLLGPPLLAVFLVSAAGVTACTAWPGRWSARRAGVLALLAVAGPLVAGLLTAAAFLAPLLEGHCHCADHGLHHPHLCPLHPAHAAALVAPGVYVLAAWVLFVAPDVGGLVRGLLHAAVWRRAVLRTPARRVAGHRVHLSGCGGLGAVTVGLLRPVIVVDPRVWDALAPAERKAVVQHEAAHARRRDALVLLGLRLWTALCPLPALRRVVDAWRVAAEHACDRYAAGRVGNACIVAAALVAVERARHGPLPAFPPQGVLPVGGGDGLEHRVQSLLADPPAAPPAAHAVLPVVALALAGGVLALGVAADGAHHFVETVLGFLFPAR